MHSPKEFAAIVQKALDAVDYPYEPLGLYEPISYALSQGGKRMRPVLCLLANEMFGGKTENAISAAIALEVFHNFTLLHDDIMDEAPLRRGVPTVYQKWDTNVAILSGDTMFAKSYEFLAESDPACLPVLLKVFSDTAIKVCEGQQYDMNFEQRDDVSVEEYIRMIGLKTAVLLKNSLTIGALIAGASRDDVEHIGSFGFNVGLAFQLMDDLLDVYADQDKFGKQLGGDIVSGKKTFLLLKAFELAKGDDLRILERNIFGPPVNADKKLSEVKEVYDRLNIKELARNEMHSFYEKAMTFLDEIKVKENYKYHLRTLAIDLFNREF